MAGSVSLMGGGSKLVQPNQRKDGQVEFKYPIQSGDARMIFFRRKSEAEVKQPKKSTKKLPEITMTDLLERMRKQEERITKLEDAVSILKENIKRLDRRTFDLVKIG